MNIAFRILIAAAALAAVLLAAAKLGSLERQARADAARVRALPPAFAYGAEPSGRTPAVGGAAPADSEWVAIPMAAPGIPITETDIDALPEPARRYLRHAGVAGKPRPGSFSVVMEGRIRNGPDAPWMPLVMRQFNRLDNPARVVFLTSPKPPMNGIDSFLEGRGRMLIKALDLIKVVDDHGPEMAVSALVTFLNDLVLCPTAYFSLPLLWRRIGPDEVELSMSHAGMTVTARLTVDADGCLQNWRTEDRYAEVGGQNLKDKWSTPFEGTMELSGLRIPATGRGIHDYDGNPFIYLELDRIRSLVLDAEGLPGRP